MAKKVGATNDSHLGEIRVESLSELSNKESSQKIADHFASISNEFLPINSETLPAFLPAQMPPQVEEYQVYSRLLKMKKSKFFDVLSAVNLHARNVTFFQMGSP